MLRVLLPSWRFFDRSDGSPRLLYRSYVRALDAPVSYAAPDTVHAPRLALPGPDLGAWKELSFSSRSKHDGAHSVHPLLLHAHGNLTLARYTLLEHLLSDLSERAPEAAGDVTELVSYRLVQRLVARELARLAEPCPGLQFQFALVLLADDAACGQMACLRTAEVLLLSSVHEHGGAPDTPRSERAGRRAQQ
jgi:hypothetical protein